MEKKRRARINTCLDQLKSLLETYYSSNRKLEKADILELTVKHLRNLQKIQSCDLSNPLIFLNCFQAQPLLPTFLITKPASAVVWQTSTTANYQQNVWRPW
uniref:BHLH domain-containing protein n=1 Tax=Echeneis naucrates TaxID=173247 RepID=A0A665UTT5_ECHNA